MKETLAEKVRKLDALKAEYSGGSNRPGLYNELKKMAAQVVRGRTPR